MKITKLLTTFLCAGLMLAAMLTLSACMKEEDYYTKSEVDVLRAELEALADTKAEECEAAIEALKAEHAAKISALEAESASNKAKIEELTEEYNAKIAELEDKNAANEEKIEELAEEYDDKITELIKIINKLLDIDSPSEENSQEIFPIIPLDPMD